LSFIFPTIELVTFNLTGGFVNLYSLQVIRGVTTLNLTSNIDEYVKIRRRTKLMSINLLDVVTMV